MEIHFFCEETNFIPENQVQIRKWISTILQEKQLRLVGINYIFCSDTYLLEINKNHLNHDYLTDIITFDNSEAKGEIESDIFISIDRVQENAIQHNTSFSDELHRVIIHGVLHLIGYDDKTPESKKQMREKEDAYLSLL